MGYGRFVGRVGALAVALGVGMLVPAVASADPDDANHNSDASTDAANAGAAGTGGPRTSGASKSAAARDDSSSGADRKAGKSGSDDSVPGREKPKAGEGGDAKIGSDAMAGAAPVAGADESEAEQDPSTSAKPVKGNKDSADRKQASPDAGGAADRAADTLSQPTASVSAGTVDTDTGTDTDGGAVLATEQPQAAPVAAMSAVPVSVASATPSSLDTPAKASAPVAVLAALGMLPAGPLAPASGSVLTDLMYGAYRRTESEETAPASASARTSTMAMAGMAAPAGPSVNYAVSDDWGQGFIGNMTVNAGDSALNGWTVEFDSPAQITDIWNAEIASHIGTRYVVRNAAWNGQVAAGQSTSFGFQATPGGASAVASNFVVNGTPTGQPVPPTISVADAAVSEGNSGTGTLTFNVSMSKASTTPVTVAYTTGNGTATAGADYTAKSGTVTFAAGETSKTITVAVTGDTAVEPTETLNVTLSNPSGATIADGTAVGTITNDDTTTVPPTSPSISVADAAVSEGNSGTGTLTFNVSMSKASTTPVTVAYTTGNGTATAGADYTAKSGTVTFAAGETSKTITVAVTGDTAVEPTETLNVTLSNPSGATIADGTAVGTITNDDTTTVPPTSPSISVADAAVSEGNSGTGTLTFNVTMSKASTTPVTVAYTTGNGTATAGTDYTAKSGTVTFAAGETSKTITVAVTGDTAVEPTETLNVTLSNPSGATIADGAAVGTITNDDMVSAPGTTAQWGNAFFAPYVDMGAYPVPNLVEISRSTGASLLTLGFMQADPNGNPAWAGLSALQPNSDHEQALAINKSIADLRAAGGDVMISFGGAAGTPVWEAYHTRGRSAQELANTYANIVDKYGVTHLDFDIEGASIANREAIALNSQALKLLQRDRPKVQIWYTLPVLPSGLTADGLNVTDAALNAGVKLAGVNVMTMNYGAAAPQSGPNAKSLGAYHVDAGESTYRQLSAQYARYGQSFSYSQLGVTPMVGVNDIVTEVSTLADFQTVEDWARAKGVGMLSMWSVNRDKPGSIGMNHPYESGVNEPAGAFTRSFSDYGTQNVVNYGTPGGGTGGGTGGGGTGGGGGTPVEGGTTTTVDWKWDTNTVLNFDPAKDKLDFVWMQSDHFDVTEQAGSTRITIVGNKQTYTLQGVSLSRLQINNIVAKDAGALAKWQTAINNAKTV